MENRKQPEIRFDGYTNDWEKRKLEDFLTPATERNNTGKYTQDNVLAASLGTELVKKHIFFGLRSTEESVKNYRVVKDGDIIYTKSPIKGYPNGIVRTSKGVEGIVPSLYCVYTSSDEVNSSIIQAYFEDKYRLDAYLYPLVNVGARNNVNITDLGFLEGYITVPPTIEEQNKIIWFLEKLSSLITLQQCKLDLLKKQKKSFLQKMFPKAGANTPEIRFAGFTDDWEERKLGDLTDEFKSGTSIKAEKIFEVGEYPVYGGNGIRGYTNTFNHNGEYALIGRQGALSGNMNFAIGKCFFTEHAVAVKADSGNDTRFLYFLMYKLELGRWVTQSAQPGLAVSTLIEIKSFIPKSIEEQQKIGSFFKQLDDTIALNQKELDLLKETKKGFLQKMFV